MPAYHAQRRSKMDKNERRQADVQSATFFQNFLRQLLSLRHGIPSHDTINRVFAAIKPNAFEQLFRQWPQGLKEKGVPEQVVAIDGKTIRGYKNAFLRMRKKKLLLRQYLRM
jgi:hypothetical protein